MVIFWAIFVLISIGGLFSYKRQAKEDAPHFGGNPKTTEIYLRYVNLIIAAILLVVGVLGLLGIIKIR